MNRNEHVPPNWVAVRLDESQHCEPEFLTRCGGKVWGVYLVDTQCVTHCCEFAPSYCMIPVDLVAGDYPEDEQERESLYDELREVLGQTNEISYMHCRAVDRLPDEHKADLGLSLDPEDWEDDANRGEDFAREEYQGNPLF